MGGGTTMITLDVSLGLVLRSTHVASITRFVDGAEKRTMTCVAKMLLKIPVFPSGATDDQGPRASRCDPGTRSSDYARRLHPQRSCQ